MRAVNLVPEDQRRRRRNSTGGANRLSMESIGPSQIVLAVLVILIALIALHVRADNHLKDQKATLAAAQAQVVTEQAQASRLDVYTSFVQAAQQREDQVRQIAQQRFPWQRTLDQLSHVLPATTSLTSLSATTSGLASGVSTATSAGVPTFTLAGCADTPSQTGTATVLRRLRALSGVTSVGFQSSTRVASCGNSFALTLGFTGAGGAATASTAAAATPAAATQAAAG